MDYEDQNIDASNFYQMPRNLVSSSLDSSKVKTQSQEEDELDQMADLIISQNKHLLEGDLDFIKAQLKDQLRGASEEEDDRILPNGNTPAYACGPLKKERYINPKIEQELIEFKQEIEDKFHESEVNRIFVFPRVSMTTGE
jgi:archaellum biogenesis ATPase FlaH